MLIRKLTVIVILILSYAFMASSAWMTGSVQSHSSPDSASTQAVQLSDPVMTEQGLVRGEVIGNTIAFRGIPYAAPPVGNLRWRATQPALQRSGVLDAVTFGPICPQFASNFPNPPSDKVSGNEDCLTLNIWAPKNKEAVLRPVMFFIHGGANTSGASSISLYDGLALSQKGGVVTVTINYRLGPLGFLGHPLLSAEDKEHNSSGNYGLLDQILALQWVQKNIRNFGGDPSNVTIFGESAGGLNVACLVASPLAAGLFQKAISESAAQSVGPFVLNKPLRGSSGSIPVETAEDFGLRLTTALGCDSAADPLACLRGKSPEDLLTVIKPVEAPGSGAAYGPNVDGYVLPGNILTILKAGQQNDVPLMIGTNKDEASTFITSVKLDTQADYEAAIRSIFGDNSDKILARYPVSDYGSPHAAFEQLITDLIFLCPARVMSRLTVARQSNTFVYQFTHSLKIAKDLGAFHGLELPFVFNNLSIIPGGVTRKENKLSEAMLAYWTNFAKKGNPNGAKLFTWPNYTLDGDSNIKLDVKISTEKALRKDLCDFLSDLFDFN